jgi:hypothetical protein
MAARDHFALKITCPKCGNGGTADVSEDDHPYMRHPGFHVDQLPEGFSVAEYSRYRHLTKVACKCGHVFTL